MKPCWNVKCPYMPTECKKIGYTCESAEEGCARYGSDDFPCAYCGSEPKCCMTDGCTLWYGWFCRTWERIQKNAQRMEEEVNGTQTPVL